MDKPTFGLADLPKDWEIQLSDELVEQLDKLNRPWAHDGSGRTRGDTVFWYRSTLRPRTKNRMTPEELDNYYACYRFSERLWGWQRRPKYHGTGPVHGCFIQLDQIPILRQGVDISDSEIERAIRAVKVSPSSDRILKTTLPITADKYWAWFIGFYYSSAAIRFRDPRTSQRAKTESIEMSFRALNPVLELAQEYAEKIGVTFRIFNRVGDHIVKQGTTKGIGTGRRIRAGFGWVEYKILEKFGMSTHFKEDKPEMNGKKMVSRFWKPEIPEWILEDEDCMTMFIEGLVNGRYGVSALSKPGGTNLMVSVMFRITGMPPEYPKKFAESIRDWFHGQGLTTSFRLFKSGYAAQRGKTVYEVQLNTWDSLWWLMDNVTIAKTDLRARLLARIKAAEDPVFNEAMIQLQSPHNVILSLLAETPMTADEIDWSLQIKREGIIDVLRSLQMKGLITKRKDVYSYNPKKFEKIDMKRKENTVETLANRANRYATRLLHRCTNCKKVYLREREICGRCGDRVESAERKHIMQSVHSQRSHTLRRLKKLKESENETSANRKNT